MVAENVRKVLAAVPATVTVLAATKGRDVSQIQEVIAAGITVIGENYVREAEGKQQAIGRQVSWHCIGHLQKNKVKKSVQLFDVIQTVDSLELAALIDKECGKIHKVIPVLIEVNSAEEPQKTGVMPPDVQRCVSELARFKNIRVTGLMTMGPLADNPERVRPYFRLTKNLFDTVGARYQGELKWQYLSMGMSSSYTVAIEEGATMVRLGSILFVGPDEGGTV